MTREARVLVIGGGPAGSATAIGLAHRGIRAVICEARRFPRVKVCGEFLSPGAVDALDMIVGAQALADAGAREARDLVVEAGERVATYRLRRPGMTLSRATLDTLLLERARDVGVEARQPALVRCVALADDGARATLASGETITADAVVHADGSGALDPAGPIRRRRGALAFKRHFNTREHGAIVGVRMRACWGAYVGVAQVEGEQATCALIARRSLVRAHRGDACAILQAALPASLAHAVLNPLQDRDDEDASHAAWLSCGGPGAGLITGSSPRSFRVGDAAAGIEPIAGEGIAFALCSGLTLAKCLEPADPLRTQRSFARAMGRWLRVRRVAARAAGELFLREGLVTALWPALRAPAVSVGAWCAATGK